MPPLPPVSKVVKVQLGFTVGNDTNVMSRFFIQYTGTAPTPTQLNTFAASIRTAWSANMSPLQTAVGSLTSVTCTDLSSNTASVGNDLTVVPGTRAGVTIPAGSAMNIQFLIARRYRGGKPKMFLYLGAGADIAAGPVWSGAFVTSVITGISTFFGAITGAGWAGAGVLSQVNVSYFAGFTVVTNPITHRARNVPTLRGAAVVDAINTIVVEAGIASQRRRNLV